MQQLWCTGCERLTHSDACAAAPAVEFGCRRCSRYGADQSSCRKVDCFTILDELMKKHLLATIVAVCSISAMPTTDCWVHRKVELGAGIYEYNANRHACYDAGVDCVIEPCDESKPGVVNPVPGGFTIDLVLDEVRFSVLDESGNWNLIVRDGKNYPFTPSDYIVVSSCPAYPQLEGVSVNLAGITTDEEGHYTVFIPMP